MPNNIDPMDLHHLELYKPTLSVWYDRVYLCYEDTVTEKSTTHLPIKGFYCYRYNLYTNAREAWNNADDNKKENLRHAFIPMCSWVPEIFDKYILEYKLRKMYWGGNIFIKRGY